MVSSNSTELDKFTRYFVSKASQVIVQSRLGTKQKVKTQCNPVGNDWFNLAIPDIKEISDEVKKCIDTLNSGAGLNCNKKFNVCIEISLQNLEGRTLILENWTISNEPQTEAQQNKQNGVTSQSLTVYSSMSTLLKSIIALTRATPAYKISCKEQMANEFVICYRIFELEDVWENIRDSRDKFSNETIIGTINSSSSSLSVSLIYRKDMTSNENKINDAMLMNNSLKNQSNQLTNNPQVILTSQCNKKRAPAFAASSPSSLNLDPLPENLFLKLLLDEKKEPDEDSLTKQSSQDDFSDRLEAEDRISQLSSTCDSFVFVEAPFAPHEQRVFGSFFNGPTPSFKDGHESPTKLVEVLSDIESSVTQLDSFVDSVCCPSNEESVITPN